VYPHDAETAETTRSFQKDPVVINARYEIFPRHFRSPTCLRPCEAAILIVKHAAHGVRFGAPADVVQRVDKEVDARCRRHAPRVSGQYKRQNERNFHGDCLILLGHSKPTSGVVDFVNERLLDTELDGIIKKLGDVGELRYSHLMPPGYHDQKPENKFGDVVIWEEILADLNSRTAETVFDTVLISRDEKTDWVSSAPLVVNGEKTQKSNRAHELDVTLAHPLLIHEFSKRTRSRTIYVVPPSFVASALHYAQRGDGQTSSVLQWFSASHKPDAVEKLATATLARSTEAPTAPTAVSFAPPEIRQVIAANVFELLSEYATAPFQAKSDLVVRWSDCPASAPMRQNRLN